MTKPATAQQKRVSQQGASVATHGRLEYYIGAYKAMRTVAIVAMAAAISASIAAAAILSFRPAPQNYSITPDGRITPMIPMAEGISSAATANFVSNAVVSSFSFDFRNYNAQLGQVKSMYTDDGYNGFVTAIKPLVEEAKSNAFVASCTILGAPVLVKSGVHGGIMKYKFQTPVLIEMVAAGKSATPRKWVVETVVDRVPQSQYPIGVAISRVVATPYPEK